MNIEQLVRRSFIANDKNSLKSIVGYMELQLNTILSTYDVLYSPFSSTRLHLITLDVLQFYTELNLDFTVVLHSLFLLIVLVICLIPSTFRQFICGSRSGFIQDKIMRNYNSFAYCANMLTISKIKTALCFSGYCILL